MSWLLRKDLLILRRSRLLVALLIVYPVAIALLLGFAISRGPTRPRVAILDQAAPGETVLIGGQRLPADSYLRQLFDQVQAVRVATRAQAIAKVDAGAVVAAVVLPGNLAARLASADRQAQLEVLYNGDALDQSLARSTIEAALAQANLGFSEQIQKTARKVIHALLAGGSLGAVGGVGGPESLVGLERLPDTLSQIAARQPPGRQRTQLEQASAFARFAAQNLTLASRVLSTIGQPIRVDSVLLHGRRTPLDTFAVVVAVSVSLMFICVLLAAGGVALEREEHTLPRLLRALVTREALLAEKTLLAAGCALLVTFAMLAGIGAFVTLDWSRVGLWLAALALGALAFGALGVAIGALAGELRAASLLAFLLSLPLAFLALVPAGSVSPAFNDAIGAISFVFPYKAALQALDAAVNRSSPAIPLPLVHLAVLACVFAALARLGLRNAE
jgi:ABC-type transport system involved in cytochrome c biogenesis permease component